MLNIYTEFNSNSQKIQTKLLSPVFLDYKMIIDVSESLCSLTNGVLYIYKKNLYDNRKAEMIKVSGRLSSLSNFEVLVVAFCYQKHSIMVQFEKGPYVYLKINHQQEDIHLVNAISSLVSKAIIKSCEKWDNKFSSFVKTYESGNFMLDRDNSMVFTKDGNKLILSPKSQNVIYAVPVEVYKDEKILNKRAGFYYTENARKVLSFRNSETSGLANGCSIQGFKIKPKYYLCGDETTIPICSSRKIMSEVYGDVDVCYCTLKEIILNNGDIGSFKHNAKHILYTNGIFYLRFSMNKLEIGDFCSIL